MPDLLHGVVYSKPDSVFSHSTAKYKLLLLTIELIVREAVKVRVDSFRTVETVNAGNLS